MILTDIEKKEYDRYFSYYDFSKEFVNKTFLVTGAKGLLGQGIIKWLLYCNELYNSNIRIIASTRDPKSIPNYIEKNDAIEYCEFLKEADYCKNINIDYVVHCATPTGKDAFTKTPYETLRVIIDGTRELINLCINQKEKGHICEMVYVSSEEVYGAVNSDRNIDEKYVGSIDSLNNRSCYPLGKKVAELMCHSAVTEYGIDISILRPTVIFGLFQKYDWDRIESEILRCIIENKDLVLKTKGLTKKSVVYSLDVVSAVFVLLLHGLAGEAYNATNTLSYDTIVNNANRLFDIFNKKCKIVFDLQDSNMNNLFIAKRELLMNVGKIESLGWKTITNLEDIYKIDIQRFNK